MVDFSNDFPSISVSSLTVSPVFSRGQICQRRSQFHSLKYSRLKRMDVKQVRGRRYVERLEAVVLREITQCPDICNRLAIERDPKVSNNLHVRVFTVSLSP